MPVAQSAMAKIGQPISRVDGRLKVTGQARYSAEAPMQGFVHAVLVQSTIASGEITSIDSVDAEKLPGVLAVITPSNIQKLTTPKNDFMTGGVYAETRMPLSDMKIIHAGQHVAVVMADTIEHATAAAKLVKIAYKEDKPIVSLTDSRAAEIRPPQFFGEELQLDKGKFDWAHDSEPSLTYVRQTYVTPIETHNPMELSATTAAWEGDQLTVWDATQYIMGTRAVLAEAFSIPRERVRVLCPFVGGGFGCKGFQWGHTLLAATAARKVNRPVKLMLTRKQMFTSCGHRPRTEQAMVLAAGKDGKLKALSHETTMHGAFSGDHTESCGMATSMKLYDMPNLRIAHIVKKINIGTPTPMRAPGECPGTFALESAMDELAVALNLDPVQLRLTNYAEKNPVSGKPWSGKNLKDAYAKGVEAFGWSKRNPQPRSTRDAEGRLVGWGMATATYPGYRFPAAAKIRLVPSDGGVKAIASSATHDLGTGAYTVFTQITAAALGLPTDRVKFELGDSTLPFAPVAGGSNSTASVGHAITQAADAMKEALLKIAAQSPDSPLAGLKAEQVIFVDGKLAAKDDPKKSVDLAALVAKSDRGSVESSSVPIVQPPAGGGSAPAAATPGENYDANQAAYAFQSFGCHFVEVSVGDPIPTVRVTRVVSVIDNGRVINHKTAGSQIMGGVIMGIGMALLEETAYDPRTGRPVTDNLADYAVCVNADIHAIESHFIDKPDMKISALGARGVGEIGITGVAAAVANAVYHATGKRVRELPITMEKLL